MADAIDTLKSILGDDAEDKIKNVMNSLGSDEPKMPNANIESLDYIMQLKSIISQLGNSHDDPRSNLLLSLRPYMRSNRQRSIDSAVKLLNMTKLAQLFRQ